MGGGGWVADFPPEISGILDNRIPTNGHSALVRLCLAKNEKNNMKH